jgi:hypothetical protein
LGIEPLRSNALAMRFEKIAPKPDFVALPRAEQRDPGATVDTPSMAEQRLRQRIGQLVANQVIEDQGQQVGVGRQGSSYQAPLQILAKFGLMLSFGLPSRSNEH